MKEMFRPGGKSTAMASDGKVKVHTTWPDGSEQVEEYDQKTEQLLTRKLRKMNSVGGQGSWEFEIGEAPPRPSDVGIVENPDNPICVRGSRGRGRGRSRCSRGALPLALARCCMRVEGFAGGRVGVLSPARGERLRQAGER